MSPPTSDERRVAPGRPAEHAANEPAAANPAAALNLGAAREALERGALEDCLLACRSALGESRPGGSDAWQNLRREALERLRTRTGEELAATEGGGHSRAARWLGLLLRHDPAAAESVHLAWGRRDSPPASGPGGPPSEPQAEFPSPAHEWTGAADAPPTARLRLSLDDAGEFLAVVGSELCLGPRWTPRGVVLPDGERPARLRRVAALRGGVSWWLEPGRAPVTVDGTAVGERGCPLRSGSRVRIAGAAGCGPLQFALRLGDPASQSVRLDLDGGTLGGAPRALLLLAPGRAGRVRIGPRSRHLLQTPSLTEPLELWIDGARLCLRSVQPWRRRLEGAPPQELATGAPAEWPLPLAHTVDLEVLGGDPRRAPFWLRLSPQP